MGTWNDFLTDTKVLSSTGRAGVRHSYDEATYWKGQMDPDLAAPYATANHVTTLAKHTAAITSGNFTVTIAFPLHSVEETTGNIAFDAVQATIQTAIDTALASVNMGTAYTAGDLDVALTGTLDSATGNNATLTANGDGVKGLYMVVTTANAGDLDADKLGTPVDVTIGTANRPIEQLLKQFDVVNPKATIVPQGKAVADGDYVRGNNPMSLSPHLVQCLVIALRSESALIGAYVDSILPVDGLKSAL